MRASFIVSEVGIGIRRNLTMTVAVVVTVAISLALLGAGLLLRAQVSTMKNYWYDKVEVSIFLAPQVTPQERDTLERELAAMPQVQQVFYESKQQAYERFTQQFEDSPDLVENVTADALPESFRVKLRDPRQFGVVAEAFATRPGVDQVLDQRRLLDRFFRVLNGFQAAALFIAAVQVVAATLLISNTIRVAAFSRRRETEIMRLVGASKVYIQLPFLLEGALAGLLGGILASGALLATKHFFIDQQLRPTFQATTAFVGWDEVWAIVPVLLLAGVLLSALASLLTLRRHLRV